MDLVFYPIEDKKKEFSRVNQAAWNAPGEIIGFPNCCKWWNTLSALDSEQMMIYSETVMYRLTHDVAHLCLLVRKTNKLVMRKTLI